ncbi:transcription initiation factor TFIID subunit 1-like [Humulus lupulus]|uniref:transcription initiation factor TFIID subunit 1-like n=1 Tax=Humulus lupulus TaxID=3486 RepID=UPI002B41527F|nr:transcription initiation factor TFIID subunit 1-like [Humulus lupulus]
MGYGSDSGSQDGRDEDDEDDYEEAGGSNRLLGFMFGNVDNSGDLDVDYLDEVISIFTSPLVLPVSFFLILVPPV